MEIVTKRFLLRDFVELDRSSFLNYQADPRSQIFSQRGEASPEDSARLFETFCTWASEQPRLNYQLAIVQRREPYALVGCCGLRGRGYDASEMELGIELAPDYWGRYAYAIEVGRALLDFGFRELSLEVISGFTVSANVRVARLAEWMGAEVVTIRPGSTWMSNQTRLERGQLANHKSAVEQSLKVSFCACKLHNSSKLLSSQILTPQHPQNLPNPRFGLLHLLNTLQQTLGDIL